MATDQAQSSASAYARMGVRPVINACGIYTDLGGACMSESVWAALAEVNREWASIPELLEASGERIASLVGADAARVVPGASASIVLGVAASIAGHSGELNETLPDAAVSRRKVLIQKGHEYKYARCALLAGARLEQAAAGSVAELEAALDDDVAAILHPAHLDAADGTLPIEAVLEAARPRGVPVLVDAAYLSYPIDVFRRWTTVGADLVCFSAKYYYGPNAGGFMCGNPELISTVGELDFTNFEGGPYRTFGRPFKLDRTAIVGTLLALEEWLEMDHERRWREYEDRVEALAGALAERLPDLSMRPRQFTLEETLVESPVNSLVLAVGSPEMASQVAERLAAGEPRVFCIPMEGELVFCVETVRPDQDEALAAAIASAVAEIEA